MVAIIYFGQLFKEITEEAQIFGLLISTEKSSIIICNKKYYWRFFLNRDFAIF
jgi:hypothetical protein